MTTDLVLGIDEAGRGPILGPMVMACVALRPGASRALTTIGVADSKRFGAGSDARAQRREMAEIIVRHAAHYHVDVIDVAVIDQWTRDGGLNRLEQHRARFLISTAPAVRRIVADGKRLFSPISHMHPRFEAVDRGEDKHVSVAAASILAKVRRDALFEKTAARYAPEFGPIKGGGYLNQPTQRFLRSYFEKYGTMPPETRRSFSWAFANDLLPTGFDPLADVPKAPRQLGMFDS